MNEKFDPKKYRGKKRVYTAVPRATRISRLWVWNSEAKEYRAPINGKTYTASRYVTGELGRPKRTFQFFGSLDDARTWQAGAEIEPEPGASIEVQASEIRKSRPFAEIVSEFQKRRFPSLADTTRVAYEKLLRLYMGSLLQLQIHELTPQRIDLWIDSMKDPQGHAMKSKRRRSFEHELDLLSSILKYYEDYTDDPGFRFPIKRRHREAVWLNRPYTPKPKDLTEEEFLLFRGRLRSGRRGSVMAALATVQFYQALRISEAAGLHWEDIRLDLKSPHMSRIKVMRSVSWPRKKGLPTLVKGGFKNAGTNQGVKEQPMFPQTFEALDELYREGMKGLVFNENGQPFEYRWIQHAFDRAFRRAELPYTATHVMRHGGTRRVYNEDGDLAVAQQLLGNSDLQSTLVYAKRQASALTKVAKEHWDRKTAEVGGKWWQPKTRVKVSG